MKHGTSNRNRSLHLFRHSSNCFVICTGKEDNLQRSVDKVEKVVLWEVGIEIHEFGCVNDLFNSASVAWAEDSFTTHTATTHGQKGVWLLVLGKFNGFPNAGILRFDHGPFIDGEMHTLLSETLCCLLHGIQLGDIRVRHDADLLDTHILEVHAHFFRAAGPESDARSSHLESSFCLS